MEFESFINPEGNIQTLIDAVKRSADSIQPWMGYRHDLSAIHGTLDRLKHEASNYSGVVKHSAVSADRGAQFAEQAKILCTHLMDRGISNDTIKQHVESMRTIARNAHDEAVSTSNAFRHSREEFNNITRQIPQDINGLHERKNHQHQRKSDAEKKHSDAGTWGIVKCVFFPPMIPWFLADMEREQREAQQAIDDAQREIDACSNAQGELGKIAEGVGHMGDHIGRMADYWVGVETALGKIAGDVEGFRERVIKLRVRSVMDKWEEVRRQYVAYSSEVGHLRIAY